MAGELLQMLAAALAMIVANVSGDVHHLYHDLLHAKVGPVLSEPLGVMTPHLWITTG